jgi:hypothetical protein
MAHQPSLWGTPGHATRRYNKFGPIKSVSYASSPDATCGDWRDRGALACNAATLQCRKARDDPAPFKRLADHAPAQATALRFGRGVERSAPANPPATDPNQ